MINPFPHNTSEVSIIMSFNVRAYQFLLVLLIIPQTNYADSFQGLKANYWNYSVAGNAYVFPTNSPDLTRIDETVDFSWGGGSPDIPTINIDNFAAQWQGTVTTQESGNYIFSTESDDGVRLWVDNQLVINNWTQHGPTWNASPAITLKAGKQYSIKMEYFESGGGAVAKLHWQTPSNPTRTAIPKEVLSPYNFVELSSVENISDCAITNQLLINFNTELQSGTTINGAERIENYSITATPYSGITVTDASLSADKTVVTLSFDQVLSADTQYTINAENIFSIQNLPLSSAYSAIDFTPSLISQGLQGSYWNYSVTSNGYNFPNSPADFTRKDETVDFDWQTQQPAPNINPDNFTVRWEGYVTSTESGEHIFSTYSDDGVRLWVNNQLIIDNWTLHSATWNSSASLSLNAGEQYSIKMEFFESNVDARAKLHWQTPLNPTRRAVPTSTLSYCPISLTPVVKYHFDELNWSNSSNDVVDSSDNGRHATSYNGANTKSTSPALSGNPGSCRYGEFDGIDDYIDSPGNLSTLQGTASLSFWLRTTQVGHDISWLAPGVAGIEANLSTDDIFWGWLDSSGHIGISVGNDYSAKSTVAVNDGVFHHITLTRNANNGAYQIFIDGALNKYGITGSGTIGHSFSSIGRVEDSDGTPVYFSGDLDEVQVFNSILTTAQVQSLAAETHDCVNTSSIDHFELAYSANGLTCQPSAISLKACENSDCSSLYTETVNVTLSPSTGWLTNPLVISAGSTSLELQHSIAEAVIVGISASSVTPDGALQCIANDVADPSCTINFAETGFIFEVPTLTACKTSADVTIKAVKKSNITDQCVGALTGSQSVNFWSTYSSPLTGTKSVVVSGASIDKSSPGSKVDLEFDINGEASFNVQYNDVGQLRLDASHTMSTADGDLTIGGSDIFISKPIALAVYSADSNAICDSNYANCSTFKKAGENFALIVKAACWESDDDTDFRNNSATPNFLLNSIPTTHSLVAPAAGENGDLTVTSVNFSASDSGIKTINQAISEVGVFNFGTNPPNYLGETLTTSNSPSIGRFYPDHFKLTTQSEGSFGDNACTGFSYSGQSFSYQSSPELTVTAYSAATPVTITRNYTGDFSKLELADFTVTTPTSDATQLGADATNLARLEWTAATPSLSDNTDGTLTFTFGDDSYRYRHETNSVIAEFSNAVDLTFSSVIDSDSVTASGVPHTLQPSGELIRFGRLAIANAHGSELVPLDIPFTTEYFNGINWTTNTADQCTVLNLATNVQLANTETAGGSWQTGTSTMTIAAGSTAGTLTNNSPLLGGQAILTLSAPGEDNEGYVDIRSQLSSTHAWLQGDYDGDGSYDDDPVGRASFGLFKGSDNIIFRRELY